MYVEGVVWYCVLGIHLINSTTYSTTDVEMGVFLGGGNESMHVHGDSELYCGRYSPSCSPLDKTGGDPIHWEKNILMTFRIQPGGSPDWMDALPAADHHKPSQS